MRLLKKVQFAFEVETALLKIYKEVAVTKTDGASEFRAMSRAEYYRAKRIIEAAAEGNRA